MEERKRKHIPKSLREKIKNKFSGRCAYCGCFPKKIHIDHFIPFFRHGKCEESNLVPACPSCNNYKMSYTVEQFRTQISEQINRLRKQSVNFRLAERYGLIKETGKKVEFYFENEQQCSKD